MDAIQQASQFRGQHAFDTQGVVTSQSSADDQTNIDALSAQQEDTWRRSSKYQSWLNQNKSGPMDSAIAQTKAMLDEIIKNNNALLGSVPGGSSGGSGNGPGAGTSSSSAVTKMATDALRSYNEQLKLTSDNMQMYDTTLSKTLTDLHSHITSTQDVTTATKAYDNEVQSIKAHQAALTAENEKIRQLLPTIPQLDSEYQTLTDTLSSNTKALSDDSQKLVDITSQVTSEITNMLQTAYQDQQKMQEDALTNTYQPQIDALNAQKTAIDGVISSLQAQWAAQDNVNKLTDLQNQLSAVMADKRFEVVGLDGKLSYTYDTAKAADLQKQISDEQTKEAHDAQIQRLNDQKAALDTEITNLTNAYNEKKQQLDAYWAWKQSTDQIQTDANNLILKNGLTGALAYVQTYTSQMIDKYNSLQQAAALAGQAIAGGLGGSGIPITGSGGSSTGLNSYWQNVKNQGGAYATPSGNGMTLAQQIQHEASMYGIDPSQVQVTSGGHTFVPWQYVQNYLNKQSAHMRNGGMVPLNMGIQGVDSVPAMLAPGEIVIPSWDHLLSGMKQINNSASTSVHIDRLEFPNVHNAADAQGFMEAFLDSVRTLR
jgi:prefoldin subunit 5